MKTSIMMVLVFLIFLPLSASADVTVSDIVGTWSIVHDDWPGTLVINTPDQRLCGVDGPCTFCSWRIDGWYTDANGNQHFIRGFFQGEDQNRHTSESCKESKHLIKFDIPFNSHRPQPFEGYVFTWGKRTMAGYTWWEGIPFGWYAEKR